MYPPSPRFQQSCRGFSLVEVLVALTIFSLSVGVLSQTCYNAIRGFEMLQTNHNRDRDYRFATRQIVQIGERDEFEEGGELETVNEKQVTWKAEVEETEIIDLFKVTLTLVHSDDENVGGNFNNEGFTQTLYLLRPGWSESFERESLVEEKKEALQSSRNFQSL